jgi:hypothetical protein
VNGKAHRFKSVLEEHAPEHLKAIGLIGIEVTNLEHSLATLFAAVIDAPEQFGQIVYLTPKTSMARLETLENVVEYLMVKDSQGERELKAIVKCAKAILAKRNRVIHGLWGITDGLVSLYQAPIQDGDKPEPFTAEQLIRIVDDTRDLVETIAQAVKALRIHHHAVRKKTDKAGKPSWRV